MKLELDTLMIQDLYIELIDVIVLASFLLIEFILRTDRMQALSALCQPHNANKTAMKDLVLHACLHA